LIAELEALLPDAPRVLLSTGKLVGEGFDHPPFDTLLLTMPISWKGTLQQYAGRLHREHATKTDVRIVDFVDSGHPALLRMWEKRQKGYRAMGYRTTESVGQFNQSQRSFLELTAVGQPTSPLQPLTRSILTPPEK
jgi:superfamily II DNA or RNA helicase